MRNETFFFFSSSKTVSIDYIQNNAFNNRENFVLFKKKRKELKHVFFVIFFYFTIKKTSFSLSYFGNFTFFLMTKNKTKQHKTKQKQNKTKLEIIFDSQMKENE